jgi:hypothetical protein
MNRKFFLKNYQKIFILLLILLVTLLISFINSSFNVIEDFFPIISHNSYIQSVITPKTVTPIDKKSSEKKHKDAAKKRSKNDWFFEKREQELYITDEKLNSV